VKRKKTEIVVELDEVFVIRRRQTIAFAWCAECGDQVQMLTPDQAATIGGLSSRLIYRWIEAGRIHFSETGEGHLLVCQSSLPKLIKTIDA
jgi:excisionase family DNA binding protein